MVRLGDIVIACSMLVVALPLMLLVSLVIKLESSGPVFVREKRLCYGRIAVIWKFRTGPLDPRRNSTWHRAAQPTGVGRFLRITRIDALPELLNVVRGDMTLLGTLGEKPDFLERC
jgi:lipopolysaccharide/colanic/teichoic acid biosynthesis glycosyltransferase